MNFTIKTIIISIIFNLSMFGQSTETQPYTLIKKIDSIEIRFYPSAKIVKTSSEDGDNNFGKLLIPGSKYPHIVISFIESGK